jgi:hypothetical protein
MAPINLWTRSICGPAAPGRRDVSGIAGFALFGFLGSWR